MLAIHRSIKVIYDNINMNLFLNKAEYNNPHLRQKQSRPKRSDFLTLDVIRIAGA